MLCWAAGDIPREPRSSLGRLYDLLDPLAREWAAVSAEAVPWLRKLVHDDEELPRLAGDRLGVATLMS
jgi:hypothetical protein